MTFSAEFAKSFVKAHGAMPKLIKDSTNPHFRSQYASLAAVIDAIRKPLADNGLALYQHATTTTDETGKPLVVVRSMLIHESGEYIEDELPMPVQKNDAQGIGSAITYGRRYAAMAICGLAPDDDDGNEATQPQQPQKQPQRQSNNGNGKQPVKQQPQPERTIETARSAFHAAGNELFGKDWETVRSGVVKTYSAEKSPDNVRTSSNDLATDELDALSESFRKSGGWWKKWLQENMAAKEPAEA